MSLAVAAALGGCGDGDPPPLTAPPVSLFPGEPDTADLTAANEAPPTEIPNPGRFFGTDPVDYTFIQPRFLLAMAIPA